MPLGYERINEKRSSPNKNIVFIKPRSGPDEATSKDFLERIAAQCLPIMNNHRLAVVSLEEYEPNLEFWGSVLLMIVTPLSDANGSQTQFQCGRSDPARLEIANNRPLAPFQVCSDGYDARARPYSSNEPFWGILEAQK